MSDKICSTISTISASASRKPMYFIIIPINYLKPFYYGTSLDHILKYNAGKIYTSLRWQISYILIYNFKLSIFFYI